MDASSVPYFFFPLLFLPLALVSLAWYVWVTVFVYKIWKKVKHLPG